ncbi:uncharacterized protein LOC115211941 [Octopus sinensis]|uniref:Uncharacterized protein LOC115211941 n=1 Tax=Octopus sinensis TaxID=2607531 RepID=A0A7E6EU25_9MOLL|nr:uncharacterized protein LOC115211941 [Octopus sinensis]XP_036358838.1 uncharacterized protein LOC115211941 [Octopus sinensis]XP_036358839.1 uncharacterized protein LOC115211941 [Octopus sinensis]
MMDAKEAAISVKDYYAALKNALKPYKFDRQPPTPQLLIKAQITANDLRSVLPRDRKGKALPYPRYRPKEEIYKKNDFGKTDSHAKNAPKNLLTTELEELVQYLISPFANDEVAKVRVIFRWITEQDLESYQIQGNTPTNSPARYLNELKESKGRYDIFFNDMCRLADISSVSIQGHSKGVGFNVGDPLTPSTRNIWNAVLIKDTWYLIDVHWASRKISGVEAEEWQLVECQQANSSDIDDSIVQNIYEFDEFYFLTDPEKFIYSHFPDEEIWQLLARPLTKNEFQKALYLKPHFFEFGLTVKSHVWCSLQSVDGLVNIELGVTRTDLSFSFELYRSNKIGNPDDKKELAKYMLLERDIENKKLCIEVRFPIIGKFKAEIFGRDSRSKLEWLCSYVLYCNSPLSDCSPLPPNPKAEWGPGMHLFNYGITPITHLRGKIDVYDGEVELKFALEKNVDLLHRLVSEDEEEIADHILCEIVNGVATVLVRLPKKGQYALQMYAKNDPNDNEFSNICNYMLRCNEDLGVVYPYPSVTNDKVGSMGKFRSLGLHFIEDGPGYQRISTTGQCSFQIKIPANIDYFCKLIHQSENTFTDVSDYTYYYRNGDIVSFAIRCPSPGFYRFDLFAKLNSEDGGYPKVFCSVLETFWPMTECLPYPQKYSACKDTYNILSPAVNQIAEGQNIKIAMVVPNAESVATIEDQNWIYLEKGEKDKWTGTIVPKASGNIISIAARQSSAVRSFEALVSFEVVPSHVLREEFRKQRASRENAEQEYVEHLSRKKHLQSMRKDRSMIHMIQRMAKMKLQNLNEDHLKLMDQQLDNDAIQQLDQCLPEVPKHLTQNGTENTVRDERDVTYGDVLESHNYERNINGAFVDFFSEVNDRQSNVAILDNGPVNGNENDNYNLGMSPVKIRPTIKKRTLPKIDINLNELDGVNESDDDSDEDYDNNVGNHSDYHLNFDKHGVRLTPISEKEEEIDDFFKSALTQNRNGPESDESEENVDNVRQAEEIIGAETVGLVNACPSFVDDSKDSLVERLSELRGKEVKPKVPLRMKRNLEEKVKEEEIIVREEPKKQEDLTEKLLQQVASIEKTIEEDEIAIQNFHLGGAPAQKDDQPFLRHRTTVTLSNYSTPNLPDKEKSHTAPVSVQTQTDNEEISLTVILENFIYIFAIFSLLWKLAGLLLSFENTSS